MKDRPGSRDAYASKNLVYILHIFDIYVIAVKILFCCIFSFLLREEKSQKNRILTFSKDNMDAYVMA